MNALPTTGLDRTRWPERIPPARSTISRTIGGAFWIVLDVHSEGNAAAAAARARSSTSSAKDEVTHDRRLSQLQPREGQAARSSFIDRKRDDQASAAAGSTGIGSSG